MGPGSAFIKGGHVVDPASGIDSVADVEIRDGKVYAVGPDLAPAAGAEIYDANGCIVTPGLIDIHGHFFYGMTSMAVDPRVAFLPLGTTVAVDGGTSGSANFVNFKTFIMEPSDIHLYAFINIYVLGMAAGAGDSFRLAQGIDRLSVAQTEATAKDVPVKGPNKIHLKQTPTSKAG